MSASQWQDFKSGLQAKFDALPDKRKQVLEQRIAAREGKKSPPGDFASSGAVLYFGIAVSRSMKIT